MDTETETDQKIIQVVSQGTPEDVTVLHVTNINETQVKFDLKNATLDEIKAYVEEKPYSEESKQNLVKRMARAQRRMKDKEGFGI